MKVTITVKTKGVAPMEIVLDGTPDECVVFITKWMSSFQTKEPKGT